MATAAHNVNWQLGLLLMCGSWVACNQQSQLSPSDDGTPGAKLSTGNNSASASQYGTNTPIITSVGPNTPANSNSQGSIISATTADASGPGTPNSNNSSSALNGEQGSSNAASTTGSSAAGSGCIGADDFTCQAEIALVKYTNQIRAGVGKAPLVQDFQLSFVARDWSQQQGSMISHTGFPSARISVFQQHFPGATVPSIAAENVALNSKNADPDAVAKAFADQWQGSPGHYANMIGDYTSIGVGIYCGDSGSSNSSTSSNDGSWDSIFGNLFGGSGGTQCTATQIFAQ